MNKILLFINVMILIFLLAGRSLVQSIFPMETTIVTTFNVNNPTGSAESFHLHHDNGSTTIPGYYYVSRKVDSGLVMNDWLLRASMCNGTPMGKVIADTLHVNLSCQYVEFSAVRQRGVNVVLKNKYSFNNLTEGEQNVIRDQLSKDQDN